MVNVFRLETVINSITSWKIAPIVQLHFQKPPIKRLSRRMYATIASPSHPHMDSMHLVAENISHQFS